MNHDIIPFDEINHAVGGTPMLYPNGQTLSPYLANIITAIVTKEFPEWLTSETLALALGMPDPKNATLADLLLYIRDLKRLKRGAQQGESAQPAIASLTALSAPTSSQGIDRASLAEAIGLSRDASKEAILADLRRLSDELYGNTSEQKEITRRLSLVGLSASAAAWSRSDDVRKLRKGIVRAFTASTGATGRERVAMAINIEQEISGLSDAQIVALSVGALAAAQRTGTLVTLSAPKTSSVSELRGRDRVAAAWNKLKL